MPAEPGAPGAPTPPPSAVPARRHSLVGTVVLLVLAAFLYIWMIGNAVEAPHLESISRGLAAVFALFALICLWLVLAVLLIRGGRRAGLPEPVVIAAFVLHPLSGFAAMTALMQATDGSTPPHWPLLVVVLLPPLLAGFALWAELPSWRAAMPAAETGGIVWGAVLLISILPFVGALHEARERWARHAHPLPVVDPAQEQAEARQRELDRFAALTADSPLRDYLDDLGPGSELRDRALAGARLVTRRQADAEALLGDAAGMRDGAGARLGDLWRLDLAPSPALCQGFAGLLRRAAVRARGRDSYRVVADELEIHLENLDWLTGASCDLGDALAAVRGAVETYPATPERDRFLAALTALAAPAGPAMPAASRRRWCGGLDGAAGERQIAACTALIRSGRLDIESLAVAFYNRGNAYLDARDAAHAIADYDQAVRFTPDYAPAYNNRGNAWDLRGDGDRAMADYDEALRRNPGFALAYNNRAVAYAARGDQAKAIADYDQALTLDPNYENALRNRGRSRFLAGDFGAAVADFSAASALRPGDAYIALWLYLARARAGPPAADALRRDAQTLDRTAWPWPLVAAFLGEADAAAVEAASAEGDAATVADHHCDARFYLGEKAALDGDPAGARRLLGEALRFCTPDAPEAPAARLELVRLGP